MTNYLIRRAFQMVFVVILSTLAIYVLLNAVPGGPLSGLNQTGNREQRIDDVQRARLEQALGLNRPFYLRYLVWVAGEDWLDEVGAILGHPGTTTEPPYTGTWTDFQTPKCVVAGGTNANSEPPYPCGRGILRFDFGESWSMAKGRSVADIIGDRLINTVRLMVIVTVISLTIAIPVGMISAVKQYSIFDYVVSTFSYFGIAMPVFWFGLLLILFFGHTIREWGLPFFPSGDVFSRRVLPGSLHDVLNVQQQSPLDYAIHLVLPVTMLTLVYLAGWSRFMRSSMLEVLRQDYVRTARAKGLTERLVIVKHAARNALIPIVTIVVLQIPDIFSGAVLTETIFNYPGMGRLFVDALGRDDWPIVMAILFISAILVVVATLIGDVLYTLVDPRIRFE
jgi:peptide/nickel transport system permease protein